MNTNRTCLIREVAGLDQYIPIGDVVHFRKSDRLFTGQFREETEKDGPSGSHVRTICLPVGQLESKPIDRCILRDVDGILQWVPVDEVPESLRRKGERMLVGIFTSDQVNSGPSGSHRRTICTPMRTSPTTLD
jgi:hypothetical protein